MSIRVAVQNAVLGLVKSSVFQRITYEPGTGEATVVEGSIEPVAAVAINELSASFATGHERRKYILQRIGWSFRLLLAFDHEVEFQTFEGQLLSEPLSISTDEGTMIVKMDRVDYSHPALGQPPNGSEAQYLFHVFNARQNQEP